MSHHHEEAITTVSATGVATAPYDTVIFACSTEGHGATGELAKEASRDTIERVLIALEVAEVKGAKIDRSAIVRTFSVQPAYEVDAQTRRRVPNGYTASYRISFRSSSVELASIIHDALTSIGGVSADSPEFKLSSLEALHGAALRDAKAKVDARFADQCQVLDLGQPHDYVIAAYDVSYSEAESVNRGRGMQAFAASAAPSGGGAPPVEVEAGQAHVTATLRVSYARAREYGGTIPLGAAR